MARLLAALFLSACTAVPPPEPSPARELTPPSNVALADELSAMVREDQEVRQRWIKDQSNQAIRDEARQLSVKHVARLREIIAAHGWPGISLVGFNGMSHAWTLAQHGGPQFLAETLPLMYEAVRSRELDESLYATSLDRVLLHQGKKQMYGTQFDVDAANGRCEPRPIEDPEGVDERRLRAGMPSLREYTEELCRMYLQK